MAYCPSWILLSIQVVSVVQAEAEAEPSRQGKDGVAQETKADHDANRAALLAELIILTQGNTLTGRKCTL